MEKQNESNGGWVSVTVTRGVKKSANFADVMYGRPLSQFLADARSVSLCRIRTMKSAWRGLGIGTVAVIWGGSRSFDMMMPSNHKVFSFGSEIWNLPWDQFYWEIIHLANKALFKASSLFRMMFRLAQQDLTRKWSQMVVVVVPIKWRWRRSNKFL